MKKNRFSTLVLAALLAGGSAFVVTGCREEGHGERIGEKIDGKSDTLKDKLEPDGKGERAGKKIDKAVDDLTH